jgi:UDP-N-acetylenolpyruvoylglucosamine reductase
MSNKVLKLRKKLVPDTQGTLQSMNKGDVLIVNIKDAKTQNIRTAASRIKNMVFEITEKGLVSETKVTRIK